MEKKFQINEKKIKTRIENFKMLEFFTGNKKIPDEKHYWTLCADQIFEESEIHQLSENENLLEENQFHGVDRDEKIIKNNKIFFPTANWYHGEWLDVIETQNQNGNFKPALIYLDTQNLAESEEAINLIVGTMMCCPDKTVLCVNLMMHNPRQGNNIRYSLEKTIEKIQKRLPCGFLEKWKDYAINNETYKANRTNMGQLYFFKKG